MPETAGPMPQHQPSSVARDHALARRMAVGDDAALGALFRIYKANLWALAMRIARDPEVAKDVVQKTLEEVWDRRSAYDPAVGTVVGWMLTIVRRRALDHRRDERTRARHEDAAMEEAEHIAVHPAMELAELRLMRDRLVPALDALTKEQRRVVELSFFEGHSRGEIARATGEPEGTVASHLRLAMVKLRRALAGHGAHGDGDDRANDHDDDHGPAAAEGKS